MKPTRVVRSLVALGLVVGGGAPAFGADPPAAEAWTGVIRSAAGMPGPVLFLDREGEESLSLTGAPVTELARLGGATVEVLGSRSAALLIVADYRIVSVGGARPIVGELIAPTHDQLALRDGDGPPIRLLLSARSAARARGSVGAKVWVVGRQLESGEYKVLRYGVLRERSSGDKSANKEDEP